MDGPWGGSVEGPRGGQWSAIEDAMEVAMVPHLTFHGEYIGGPWSAMKGAWRVHGGSMDGPWTVNGVPWKAPWCVMKGAMEDP